MSEHAQCQSSGTSSLNNLMGLMMDILSCQNRKSTGEINNINDGSGAVRARSLTDLLAVTLNGMKPFAGHNCVGPQDVCCETHQYGIQLDRNKAENRWSFPLTLLDG